MTNQLQRKLRLGEFARILSGPFKDEIVILVYGAKIITSLTNPKNTWKSDNFIHPVTLINCEIIEKND